MHISLKIAAALLLATAMTACNRPDPTPGVNTGKGYWAVVDGKAVWKEYHSSRPGGSAGTRPMKSTYSMGLGNGEDPDPTK